MTQLGAHPRKRHDPNGGEARPRRRLFTVHEYERMIPAGILYEGERVELIEGEILHKWKFDRRTGMPLPRLFTVDEYERMIAAGIIHEGERVELIEGEIVKMASMGSLHAGCVRRTQHGFEHWVVGTAIVSVQCPIRLPSRSEPEPDVALLRPRADFYANSHPTPDDILLLIEVAHSSLAPDRRRKIPMYARAGIREVWLVNLDAGVIELYRDPHGSHFRAVTVHRRGDMLTPLDLPDLRIDVSDILGPESDD